MSHILGIGVGLFLIIAVWTTAIILCIISQRTHNQDVEILIFIKAVIVTLVLVFVPRESETPAPPVFKLYDHLFVVRPVILTLLAVSSVAGFIFFVLAHLMEPRRAEPLKEWKL